MNLPMPARELTNAEITEELIYELARSMKMPHNASSSAQLFLNSSFQ